MVQTTPLLNRVIIEKKQLSVVLITLQSTSL